MINPNTNWVVVIGAAVASMVLGFLWYSPILFGREWQELMGFKKGEKRGGMMKGYAIMAIASVVSSFVLKQFIDLFYIVNFFDAIQLAFWIWLGFQATVIINQVIFGGKSWKLFVIDSGYQLGSLLLMSWILSYWA